MSRARNDCKVYVGNLPPDIRTKDLEDLFDKYGKIVAVELKNRGDPPFAFVEFEDPRDADDAVRYRDGYDYDGYRIRVEHPRGPGPRPSRGGGGGGGFFDRGFGGGGRMGGGGGMRSNGGGRGMGGGGNRGSYRRTNYRVVVSGLPPTGSWQDLKDHMREAGDVCYTDVFKDGTGVVEFQRYDDMKYAIRKLDDTKFRSHEGDVSYVRVKEDVSAGGRSPDKDRSRSPVRRDRRSPSYTGGGRGGSRRRSPSYSAYRRSRSGSDARNGDSRSRSRSRS